MLCRVGHEKSFIISGPAQSHHVWLYIFRAGIILLMDTGKNLNQTLICVITVLIICYGFFRSEDAHLYFRNLCDVKCHESK